MAANCARQHMTIALRAALSDSDASSQSYSSIGRAFLVTLPLAEGAGILGQEIKVYMGTSTALPLCTVATV